MTGKIRFIFFTQNKKIGKISFFFPLISTNQVQSLATKYVFSGLIVLGGNQVMWLLSGNTARAMLLSGNTARVILSRVVILLLSGMAVKDTPANSLDIAYGKLYWRYWRIVSIILYFSHVLSSETSLGNEKYAWGAGISWQIYQLLKVESTNCNAFQDKHSNTIFKHQVTCRKRKKKSTNVHE